MNFKCVLFFCASISMVYTEKKFNLKQVVILSRHSVRTPLSKYLNVMTPKTWPSWNEKMGYLTAKGALLEGFMGEYFSMWLKEEGLLPVECPTKEDFYVYANSKQRTKASAQAFVNKAFPDCNITVHHSGDIDPIFNPVIHNDSTVFRDIVISEMTECLESLNLNSSYEKLEDILDYKHSQLCVKGNMCDFTKDKNEIINVVKGQKPNLWGPLKISNSVIDAFIMQYYEGFPSSSVAWGLLNNILQWKSVMNLSRSYHNVIFNTTLVAKDIAKPLMNYVSNLFLQNDSPKAVLLMGHDANMYTLLKGFDFKLYTLKNQLETCPVGGKIVIQKWFDVVKNVYLLKIDYVYQSTDQLRDGQKLSLSNPPQFELLRLENCNTDNEGFCLWDDFVKILKGL